MKTTVIIVGHGNYGTGIGTSLKLLAGDNIGVEFVDFLEEDSDISLKDKIRKTLENSEATQILFVCDILGGTPFKTCVELSMEGTNMEVTAGCNLGAILETVLLKDTMEIKELAENIVNCTKDTTVRFEKAKPATVSFLDDSMEEGI
ncbi:PTS sugar transporter subunit IIA [Clostridium folliculivorans]|uniref:PTS sugar transporter subunit IIA n=1 Tax=Clostridium folliculivorans TaxID=2886038 RepID=UPI0021C41E5A|nr:PTS sugar transporter subunit IIA [Clostridium folliculivorans]GKU31609.1 PTS sugar transporter subunit IIA [Clostridium folliculivorans]